jgi:hypothetical protein
LSFELKEKLRTQNSKTQNLYDGDAFDLDLRAVFEEALDFDKRHGGIVTAHLLAPTQAYLSAARSILFFVRDVDDQASDAAWRAASFRHDREHISESAVKLLYEIIAHQSLRLIPTNLPRDKEEPHIGLGQQPVRVATWLPQAFWIDALERHFE